MKANNKYSVKATPKGARITFERGSRVNLETIEKLIIDNAVINNDDADVQTTKRDPQPVVKFGKRVVIDIKVPYKK